MKTGTRKYGLTERICALCGAQFMARNDSIKKGMGRFCTKSCQVKDQHINGTNKAARSAEDHHWWKGGRYVSQYGYVHIPAHGHHLAQHNGYALEHRIVAEQMLGRRLTKDDVIHHRDRDRTNNAPENLEIHTNSSHAALHRREGRKK